MIKKKVPEGTQIYLKPYRPDRYYATFSKEYMEWKKKMLERAETTDTKK